MLKDGCNKVQAQGVEYCWILSALCLMEEGGECVGDETMKFACES